MSRKRRGYHEGAIYQRKDGKWVAAISLGPAPNKRRRRKTALARTKQEAVAKLRTMQARFASGAITSSRRTVAHVMTEMLAHIRATRRFATWRAYDVSARNHVVPRMGHLVIQDVRPPHVQLMIDDMARAGVGTRTQLQAHHTIARLFAFAMAVERQYVAVSPVRAVPRPQHVERLPEIWTAEEARAFLDKARDEPRFAAFVLALTAGLRAGEIRGLRWADVDLDRGIVSIQQQHTGRAVGPPKTESSRRQVRLPQIAIQALTEHRERLRAQRPKELPLVFGTVTGKPWMPGNMHRDWTDACRRAGARAVHIHDLRHSCATLLLASGVDAKVVTEILGHADVSITLQVYAHVLPPMRTDAASRLDAALGAPSSSHAAEPDRSSAGSAPSERPKKRSL